MFIRRYSFYVEEADFCWILPFIGGLEEADLLKIFIDDLQAHVKELQ
jgi:hypothetical protein